MLEVGQPVSLRLRAYQSGGWEGNLIQWCRTTGAGSHEAPEQRVLTSASSRCHAYGRPSRVARKPRAQRVISGESACKPGFVESNHSSRTCVTTGLEQPTRKRVRIPLETQLPSSIEERAALRLPYLALLQVGFAMPPNVATGAVRSYRTVSPLPARRFPTSLRRFAFCCTFRGLAPPRRYLAPDPPEPGLSSTL